MIFYIVQRTAGILAYFCLRCISLNYYVLWTQFIILFFFRLKLPIWPFILWIISVSITLNKISLFLLLIIRKIPVLIIIDNFFCHEHVYSLFLILILALVSRIQGIRLGLNVNTFNGLLVCRRLSNTLWLLTRVYLSVLVNFFLIYSYCLFQIISTWSKIRLRSLIYIISLTAIPPFFIFWPKLSILYELGLNGIFFLLGLLLIIRIGSIIFYLKFCLSWAFYAQSKKTSIWRVFIILFGGFLISK